MTLALSAAQKGLISRMVAQLTRSIEALSQRAQGATEQVSSVLTLLSYTAAITPTMTPYLVQLRVPLLGKNPLSKLVLSEMKEVSFILYYLMEVVPVCYPLSVNFLLTLCNVEREQTIPVWNGTESVPLEQYFWGEDL